MGASRPFSRSIPPDSLVTRILTFALILATACVASGALAPVSGQETRRGPLRATDLVEWSARIAAGDAKGEADYVISGTVADGWRLYAIGSESGLPTTVTFGRLPEGVVARGPIRQSRPSQAVDAALGEPYTYHAGSFRFAQPLRVSRSAAGRHRLSSQVRFAVCNDSVCLPPTTVDLRATLTVNG